MTRKNSAFAALTLGAAAAILATGPSTAQTRPEEARAAREVFGWKKSGDQWVQGRFRVDGAPVGGARAVRSRA
ncbi:hypothetical protein, partial [Enterovirga sp.]|uniref:hypothetical protein n=1 Tax=Enterovirga sp. TaxID=2026350 RepID=UPI00260BD7DF